MKGSDFVNLDFDLNSNSCISIKLTKKEWNNLIKFLELTKVKRSSSKDIIGYASYDLKTGKSVEIVKNKKIQQEILNREKKFVMTSNSLRLRKFLTYSNVNIVLDDKRFINFRNLCFKSNGVNK